VQALGPRHRRGTVHRPAAADLAEVGRTTANAHAGLPQRRTQYLQGAAGLCQGWLFRGAQHGQRKGGDWQRKGLATV
jgi:hypothetical protein